jgi:hypothetical protein
VHCSRHARFLLLFVCACLAALLLDTPARGADTTLKTKRFTTRYPSSWHRAREKHGGKTEFTLTAPGTTVRQLGLPTAPGGAAITVWSWTARAFRHDFHRRAPSRSGRLLDLIVGIPRDATDVKDAEKRRAIRVAGANGAAVGYRYRYKGRNNLQLDFVARHGSTVVFAELDMDPAVGDGGLTPWRTLRSSWRWR